MAHRPLPPHLAHLVRLPPSESLQHLLTGDWTGLITALPSEAETLLDPPPQCNELVALDAYRRLAVCGIGPNRAEEVARNLVTLGARALVSWGTAGGLDQSLAPGTLILSHTVVTDEQQVYNPDAAWRQRMQDAVGKHVPVVQAKMLSGRELLNTRSTKNAAYRRTGAVAVDMESGAIAQVARQNNLPLLVIRVIVDTANDALPPSALAAIDAEGRPQTLNLLRTLARRPLDMPGLITLGSRFNKAKATLKTIADKGAGALVYR